MWCRQRYGTLFPGQGNHYVGMGKCLALNFPVARRVFEEIEESLQFQLTRLMWDGQEEELRLTQHAQPAIFAHSVATLAVLRHEIGGGFATAADAQCRAAAGHSLGEYAAMVSAGMLSVTQGAQILQTRSVAMAQVQVDRLPGEPSSPFMVTLMPCDETLARKVLELSPGCELASVNSAKIAAISGSAEAIRGALEVCRSGGAGRRLRTAPLNVSAPFHCSHMQPAANQLEAQLQERLRRTGQGAWQLCAALRAPGVKGACPPAPPGEDDGLSVTVPVLSNVRGVAVMQTYANAQFEQGQAPSAAAAWAHLMARQIVEPVDWHGVMQRLWPEQPAAAAADSAGAGDGGRATGGTPGGGVLPNVPSDMPDCECDMLVAIGPGQLLESLAPTSPAGFPKRRVISVGTTEDVKAFVRTMEEERQ
jgi:[acyl-carrier-protein] S-malonyltransferase